MTEQEEDLLTDSGSILCCSRKAENSTNRNGYDKKKKIIMDIKIYLTKIINSNLLKSTKFFSTINFDWNGLWRCWFLFLIKKIRNNIILMDASLKVQCGKCRLTHHKLQHLFTPKSNIIFSPLSGIVLVNLLQLFFSSCVQNSRQLIIYE